MRSSNEESIKDVIEQLIRTYQLGDKLNQVKLLHSWERIMGEVISKRTDKIILKDGILFLHLNSAPLKEELTYGKEKIKNLLNEELGGDFIKEVLIR
jgi:hypothetical protein